MGLRRLMAQSSGRHRSLAAAPARQSRCAPSAPVRVFVGSHGLPRAGRAGSGCRPQLCMAAAAPADAPGAAASSSDVDSAAIRAHVDQAAKTLDDIIEEVAQSLLLSEATSIISGDAPEVAQAQAIENAIADRLDWLDANFLAAVNAYIQVPGARLGCRLCPASGGLVHLAARAVAAGPGAWLSRQWCLQAVLGAGGAGRCRSGLGPPPGSPRGGACWLTTWRGMHAALQAAKAHDDPILTGMLESIREEVLKQVLPPPPARVRGVLVAAPACLPPVSSVPGAMTAARRHRPSARAAACQLESRGGSHRGPAETRLPSPPPYTTHPATPPAGVAAPAARRAGAGGGAAPDRQAGAAGHAAGSALGWAGRHPGCQPGQPGHHRHPVH
jgi:hypothetical protein